MMILQGVGHPLPHLGVCCVNDPQKGGGVYNARAHNSDESPGLQERGWVRCCDT